MKKMQKNSKGFTLIEVVIVLAIGALIILVVVQAIGAARRSQRDSARKQEAARVASLLEQIASNDTSGEYPELASDLQTELEDYDETLADQYRYDPYTGTCPADVGPNDYIIQYTGEASTGTSGAFIKDFDMLVCLEAGDNADYSLNPDDN